MAPCTLKTLEGGSALRAPSVTGSGTDRDDLRLGRPFILLTEALESTDDYAYRYIRTSPIISMAFYGPGVEIRTESGSRYLISYIEA